MPLRLSTKGSDTFPELQERQSCIHVRKRNGAEKHFLVLVSVHPSRACVHAPGSSGADLGSGIACWRMSASSVVRSRRAGRSFASVSDTM